MEKSKSSRPRTQIKIDDTLAKGVYSNTAFIHHNENEIVLDFLFLEPPRPQGHVVSRVVTNPKAAKQLVLGLTELIKHYEERYGTIDVGKKEPPVSSDNYH